MEERGSVNVRCKGFMGIGCGVKFPIGTVRYVIGHCRRREQGYGRCPKCGTSRVVIRDMGKVSCPHGQAS